MNTLALTPQLLESAYRQGYFPMYDPDTGETSWYSPDPRAILPLEAFHVSRSLKRCLRRGEFRISLNSAFRKVMEYCAADRPDGTWISGEFVDAYEALHRENKCHSVEVWLGDSLVGGTYGVALGGGFFAESMFHRKTDASKVALYHLVDRLKKCGYHLLEVQFLTPHLESLGAIEISATDYEARLRAALEVSTTNF